MLTRRTVILAAEETTYGTDPAMTGSNGLLAWDVELDIKGEVLKRSVYRDTLSPLPNVIGMKEILVTFKAEMKGNGVTGTRPNVPELHPLLRGCAFGTASAVGTAITYNLVSSEDEISSTALKVYKDGNLHKITGARGTAKAVLEAGKYGVMEFEFSGLYNAVIASTIPDISGLTDNKPPIVYNSSFQIGGFSPVCSRMQVDLGNQVVRRDDLNATFGVNSFRIAAREPKIEFDVDAVVESSNPFWGDWAGEIVDTYSISIQGSVANTGNIIDMSGFFQYETNKYGDADGISTYEITATLCSSGSNSQNDELEVKFR